MIKLLLGYVQKFREFKHLRRKCELLIIHVICNCFIEKFVSSFV